MLSIEQKQKLHRELLDKIHELYITKNHDYGDSVHKTYEKYGMTSYLVRVEDKLNRVNTLTKNGFQAVNDEKISDSLLDAANYLILAAIELENDKSKRVSEEPTISIVSQSILGDTYTTPGIISSSYTKYNAETPYTYTAIPSVDTETTVTYSNREKRNKGGKSHEYRSNSNKTNRKDPWNMHRDVEDVRKTHR